MDLARVSIFVGGLRPLPESGRPTGMYKSAVAGPIQLGPEGFEGDRQADRRVHGGPDKAVHLYPACHLAALAARFPDIEASLVPGALGENLSTPDLDERDVRIGEIWSLGEAQLQVSQPRSPCWKIDERLGCPGVAAHIAETGRTGWYWRVLRPGMVHPGDALRRHSPAANAPTLHEAMALWREHRPPLDALARLADTPGMAHGWREKLLQRLEWLKKSS